MPDNVKETKKPKANLMGENRLAAAGKLPSSMKPCMNCGEPIMQSQNSCAACGAYQTPNGLLKSDPRTLERR